MGGDPKKHGEGVGNVGNRDERKDDGHTDEVNTVGAWDSIL